MFKDIVDWILSYPREIYRTQKMVERSFDKMAYDIESMKIHIKHTSLLSKYSQSQLMSKPSPFIFPEPNTVMEIEYLYKLREEYFRGLKE